MLQSADRVHFTHLKAMSDSPAHYRTSVEEGFESAAFTAGRLVHYLALGGQEGEHFVVWEDGDRRGKAWTAFKELHAGKEIFKRNEVEEAYRIAAAVRMDPVVQRLGLLEGESELLIDWDNAGVPFRSHVDKIGVASVGARKGRRHLWDLKTTTCSKPEKFGWEARRYAYHAQLATYEDAARWLQLPPDDVFIVAVEKTAPYCVVVYLITAALLEEGRKLARGWLERLRVCQATSEWPGYVQDVVPLDVLATVDEGPLLLTMHDGSEVAA